MSEESVSLKQKSSSPCGKRTNAFIYRDVTIIVIDGDLTAEETEAIICPANSYGHMRGGVAGVIRDRGGNVIESEARAKAPVRIGQAVSTTAGTLRAKRVFHAPTMQEPVEVADPINVVAAMRASLSLAFHERLQSVSFPGMGTGTGALPYRQAAVLMVRAIREAINEPHTLHRIHLVARSERLFEAFLAAIEQEL